MFCGYCGANLPEEAEFCGNCGKAVIKPENSQENHNEGKKNTVKMKSKDKASANSGKAKLSKAISKETSKGTSKKIGKGISQETKEKLFNGLANLKGDKKKLGIVVAVAAVVVVAVIVGNIIKTNRRIGELEEAIYHISASGNMDEDEIIRLYEKYDSLSDSGKRKVSNREIIINAYQQAEARIAQYRQAASQVDMIIGAIDYSNIYAEASTVKDAVTAYNNLDEKTKKYITSYNQLKKAYDDVGNLNMSVTADNFWDLFAIEYSVGEKSNYGEGTITTYTGSTINWDRWGGTITPNYSVDTYNDYATPVYIYIQSRYPNLTSNCSFYMDLHQTYQGIGLVDSDTHEFKLQSTTIQFDSSQGIGAYLINVEDNDASKSLWNLVGMSFDFSDSVHKMNPFDASRVEISDVSGWVSY